MTRVTAIIIATITFLFAIVLVVILYARGYRLDITHRELSTTGILVVTSDPDGAEVFINGLLRTATNNTISLAPGTYDVKIQKDGFSPWQKKVNIKKEEVFKTNVFLFPSLPDLRPLTLTSAKNPILSPDGAKIAYAVASASAQKNGLYVLDMGRGILNGNFLAADIRQIWRDTPFLSLSESQFIWSPEGRQLLAYMPQSLNSKTATIASQNAFLLDIDRLNDNAQLLGQSTASLLSQWDETKATRAFSQKTKLAPTILSTLATSSANLTFSPDETKILYQATASANLPPLLVSYLPGSNPTPEIRQIQSGNTYVYDLKEDRNYLIQKAASSERLAPSPSPLAPIITWFPSSRHLLVNTDKEIAVVEFDGTNKATIYSGPFINGFVFPWPNWGKLVILTNLNSPSIGGENLYTVNLR